LVLALVVCVQPPTLFAGPPLQSLAEVRRMHPGEISNAPAFNLDGVVTFASTEWGDAFFVDDGEAGAAFLPPQWAEKSLKPGERIHIEGRIEPGKFAPILAVSRLVDLGAGTLPAPRHPAGSALIAGGEDAQWVEVDGVVLQTGPGPGSFDLLESGQEVQVRVDVLGATGNPTIGSALRVRAVCVSDVRPDRRFAGARLICGDTSAVTVLEAASDHPFDEPTSRIGDLLTFGTLRNRAKLHHIEGVVTALRSDLGIYIQEGTHGVMVQPLGAFACTPGTLVEAVGFPGSGFGAVVLHHARLEIRRPERLPIPLTITGKDLDEVPPNVLVRVGATFRQAWRQNGMLTMLMTSPSEDKFFACLWPAPAGLPWEKLVPGTEVQVTGVVAQRQASGNDPARETLWLTGERAVSVTNSAPYLTGAQWARVAGIVGVAAAVLGWAWLIARRQLRQKNAALEAEYTRLAEAEHRHLELVEHARDAIFELDQGGRTIAWNKAALALFGISDAEARGGIVFEDFLDAGSRAAAAAWVAASFADGEGAGLLSATVVSRGGIRTPVEIGARRMAAVGGPPTLQCVSRDLTDRFEAEQALREHEAAHRAVVETLAEGVLIVDAHARTVTANQMALSLLQVPRSVLTERSVCDLEYWRWLDAEGNRITEQSCPTRQTIDRGVMHRNVILGADTAGRGRVWIALNTAVVRPAPGGGAELAALSFRDITEQRAQEAALRQAKEAAEAASRAKTDFLAVMSHEIRTPLNGVIGFTDLLMETSLDDEQRRFTETIRSSGETLIEVVNDILDLSKIEAGKLELQWEPFHLPAVVEAVATLVSARAGQKGVEVIVDYHPDAPLELMGDRSRVRQVLTNLAGNAVKFTATGSVVLEVRPSATRGDEVEVRVTDTGEGIAEEDLSKLFNRFQQVGAAAMGKGGTGLGLAICKQLTEKMGGRIGCESTPGVGSTFWFTLPVTAGFGGIVAAAPAELEGARVLLLSDSAPLVRAVERRLKSWGCAFDSTDSPIAARALVKGAEQAGQPFEFAILDLHPAGLSDARELVRQWGREGGPAVVLIGGRGIAPAGEQGMAHIAPSAPPVQPDALRDALLAAWSRSVAGSKGDTDPEHRVLVAISSRPDAMMAAYLLERLGYKVRITVNAAETAAAIRERRERIVLSSRDLADVVDGDAGAVRPGEAPLTVIRLDSTVSGGEPGGFFSPARAPKASELRAALLASHRRRGVQQASARV
jgi:PAS domain S-box-containing protein